MDLWVTREDVLAGKVTDVYFERTVEVLAAKGISKRVVAEVIAKDLPEDWPWGVLCGIEECADLLSRLRVKVEALPEASVFYPWEPVLVVEGRYEDFAEYETAILGMLCQATGVATAAARCRKAAGERTVISFGARRVHPAVVPMVERAAYVGGCDGVSTVIAAERLGLEPSGTMPHALCLMLGSTRAAIVAFDEVIERGVPRVALIDTFADEKFEAVAAAEALGRRLAAVRLDTPASRRGSFRRIVEEVRWELDLRGFTDVKIFVSGGINEKSIAELNDYADGYGVGTRISAAPTVDFALDIVEVEGRPFAKRGKLSGRKRVLACRRCGLRATAPAGERRAKCECGGTFSQLLRPLVADGKRMGGAPTLEEIRRRAARETADLAPAKE